ncbi:MAG: hypothetical protein OXK76_07750 [Gammaproteobacteria bacterium]|nr:hypothetical protein [Gammaproteobacteria bacterium]
MTEGEILAVRQRDGMVEFDRHMQAVQREELVLKLPRSVSHAGGLGRSVSFAQLIATWAAACRERRILTTLPVSGRDDIDRFASRLHGLAAAYYASCVAADDGVTNLRRSILEAAAPRISAMSERLYESAARGPLTELIFVHHARHQFHSAVYRRRPAPPDLMDPERHGELIVSPREMNALLVNVLRAQRLPRADFGRIAPLLKEGSYPLGTLLHETFRNTAEHAYLDEAGRTPRRGLRCIVIAARNADPKELNPRMLVSAQHPELEEYFGRLRERATLGQRRLVHMLELSVLDTGPGFTATIAGQAGPEDSDAGRVALCFVDHVSRKGGPNSGLGLGRVLSHLRTLGGFLRIRTSTTEAFFSPFSQASGQSPAPHVAGDLPKAVGTALTMAVPLEV